MPDGRMKVQLCTSVDWHLDQDVNGAPRNCLAGLAMTKKKPMTVLLMGTYYALGIFCVHCL